MTIAFDMATDKNARDRYSTSLKDQFIRKVGSAGRKKDPELCLYNYLERNRAEIAHVVDWLVKKLTNAGIHDESLRNLQWETMSEIFRILDEADKREV